MKYYDIITLKDGRQCCLRNGTEADIYGEDSEPCSKLHRLSWRRISPIWERK